MKKTLYYLLAVSSLLVFGSSVSFAAGKKPISSNPVVSVPAIDLFSYEGTWYEIARYPNRFQRKCVSDVTADYIVMDDGKVDVLNSCTKKNGKTQEANGVAWLPDPKKPAQLKVSFFWPFSGKYWVIDLDKEYRYSVVSEPKRKYLWILSRTPELDPETLQGILERLKTNGYNIDKLIWTKHTN